MITNFKIDMLSGGVFRCDPNWNKSADELDQCFKFYFVVEGEAVIHFSHGDERLTGGNLYLINGYDIQRQECADFMDVFWVHFVPDSLYIKHLLFQAPAVSCWKAGDFHFSCETMEKITGLFVDPFIPKMEAEIKSVLDVEMRLRAVILYFLGLIIGGIDPQKILDLPLVMKLKPSIDFMNEEYMNNPPLEEIAAMSKLSSNYFHRLFKQTFRTSPFDYMMHMRLDKAISLLQNTSLSVKEIAYETGFKTPFYFSRIFKKYIKHTPSELRARSLMSGNSNEAGHPFEAGNSSGAVHSNEEGHPSEAVHP